MSVTVFVCIIWSKRENKAGYVYIVQCAVPKIDFFVQMVQCAVPKIDFGLQNNVRKCISRPNLV